MTSTPHEKFCSGIGQYHSESNKKSPKPYLEITLEDVLGMLEHPQAVEKSRAQWAIFSSLKSRAVKDQREQGRFYCLWVDIDKNSQPLKILAESIAHALQTNIYAYTSRSATQENQKGRLIIPLAASVGGDDFEILQHVLNNELENLEIIPDRATERANQICYLPNRGDFYEHISIKEFGNLEAFTFFAEKILKKKESNAQRTDSLRAQADLSRLAAIERMQAGGISPIDAFNAEFNIDLMLSHYGYQARGDRWVSPNSEGGSAGVTITSDGKKWCSHHGSDAALKIGELKNGLCWGDSFDLFTHYNCDGDRNAALKAAGEMFVRDGLTLTKCNQIAHVRGSNSNILNGIIEPVERKTFKDFSMRGQSSRMHAQMLTDSYVLNELALLGQMTVIYAKPNSGKTLLTLWLLIDGIKRAQIKAENVYYINADDNYKGLCVKTKISEDNGFEIIAPGHNGFEARDFLSHLQKTIEYQDAHGKIIILDTLKKFTDIMDKKVGSEFGRVARSFVSNGGSIIMLAHTNKNRDHDGKVVFSGTSDIVDDVDCAYTLDITSNDGLVCTVLFENIKSRGDVAREAAYSYASKAGDYRTLLASVSKVNATESVKELQAINAVLAKNSEAIEAITEAIEEGITKKTELIKTASDTSCHSIQKIKRALHDHTGKDYAKGHRWEEVKGCKAVKEYRLLAKV